MERRRVGVEQIRERKRDRRAARSSRNRMQTQFAHLTHHEVHCPSSVCPPQHVWSKMWFPYVRLLFKFVRHGFDNFRHLSRVVNL